MEASSALFPGLLTALSWPTDAPADRPRHETSYLDALCQALEEDITAGRLGVPQDKWMETVVRNTQGEPDALASRTGTPIPSLAHRQARQKLLHRLMDIGVDPWAPCQASGRVEAGNTVGLLLAQGDLDLVMKALRLPSAPNSLAGQGVHISTAEGSRRWSFLSMAARYGNVDLMRALLERKADIDGAILDASTPEIAVGLLQAGASIEERGPLGAVISTWIRALGSDTATKLTSAIEAHTQPMTRIQQGMDGKAWGPLREAMASFPQWAEELLPVGQVALRIHVKALASVHRKNELDKASNALRMLSKAPPTHHEIAPGLTEMAFVRMCLRRILRQANHETKPQLALGQLAQKLLEEYGGSAPGSKRDDARAFLQNNQFFRGCFEGTTNARSLLVSFDMLDAEKGKSIPDRLKARTVEDLALLGRACTLAVQGKARGTLQGDAHELVFGLVHGAFWPSGAADASGDARHTWIKDLAQKHPEQINEIASNALRIALLGLWDKGSDTYPQLHSLYDDTVEQVCRWIDQGAVIDWDMREIERMKEIASETKKSTLARRLADQLPANIQAQKLNQGTPDATRERGGIRL